MTRSTALPALAAALPALGLTSSLHAQSSISPAHRFAYSENCGWLNFRDAGTPAGAQGVRVGPTFLSGFCWAENLGWITLGRGTPANGIAYSNTTGVDFGVNRDAATGLLSGMAWGENVGWINFAAGAGAAPAAPARIDTAANRLRGYAWGENIGWINLDDAAAYVGLLCPADFNLDGTLSVQDIFDFLTAWFAADPRADFNGGGLSVQDIFDYLGAWFSGCP